MLGGDDGRAVELASGFFAIALPGIAVYFAANVADGVLKGAGDTRTPMRLSLLANGLILVLDPLFVFGLGLGVRGAAVSTVLGRTAALACGLVALHRRGSCAGRAPGSRVWPPTCAGRRRPACRCRRTSSSG